MQRDLFEMRRETMASADCETDAREQWLAERTTRDPQAMVTVGDAFRDYADFCRERGMTIGSKNGFGRALTARGVKRAPGKSVRRFVGFRLRGCHGTDFDDDYSHLI